MSCLRCGKLYEIAELLTRFAQPELLIQPTLEQLHHELAEVKDGVTRQENYAADAADAMRRMLRIVSTEVDDCPRLFTASRPSSLQLITSRLRLSGRFGLTVAFGVRRTAGSGNRQTRKA